MPPTILLNVGEKLRERDTQRGRKFKNFQSFLSLFQSRAVLDPTHALSRTPTHHSQEDTKRVHVPSSLPNSGRLCGGVPCVIRTEREREEEHK